MPIDRARHREKGQPLCMEQYYRLFSSYRQPGTDMDRLITVETVEKESDHIIVMCRSNVSMSCMDLQDVKQYVQYVVSPVCTVIHPLSLSPSLPPLPSHLPRSLSSSSLPLSLLLIHCLLLLRPLMSLYPLFPPPLLSFSSFCILSLIPSPTVSSKNVRYLYSLHQ